MSAFDKLYAVNVSGHTEKKKTGNTELTYLSWPFAWAEVKKAFPDAQYEVVKRENGLPYVFDHDTGYMVNTRVTIDGVTHEMWLPVMDGANKAMKDHDYTYFVKNPNFRCAQKGADGVFRDRYGKEQPEYIQKTVEPATMFDVNKTIMRCLVKNLAMFGLGLYIYAGEDLPEGAAPAQPEIPDQPETPEQSAQAADRYIAARHELTAAIAAYVESSGKPKADVLAALKEVSGGTMKTEQGCILLINQLKAWSK